MNSKVRNIIAMYGVALAGMSVPNSSDPFYIPEKRAMTRQPKIKPVIEKELREFNINGKSIMAYSRKDAIKRLRHL